MCLRLRAYQMSKFHRCKFNSRCTYDAIFGFAVHQTLSVVHTQTLRLRVNNQIFHRIHIRVWQFGMWKCFAVYAMLMWKQMAYKCIYVNYERNPHFRISLKLWMLSFNASCSHKERCAVNLMVMRSISNCAIIYITTYVYIRENYKIAIDKTLPPPPTRCFFLQLLWVVYYLACITQKRIFVKSSLYLNGK